MLSNTGISQQDILRAALFIPCASKEHLHRWLKAYLGVDYPDTIVCDEEWNDINPTNSSPMDLVWKMYDVLMKGGDPKFSQVLGYASRGGLKSLSASIMEVLCLLHVNCNVIHMAALEVQAKKCQDYVNNFLKRPILNEFMTSKNKRIIEVTKYKNTETGIIISPLQYENVPDKEKYIDITNYVKIIVATVESANGEHEIFCVNDEVDLIDPAAFAEAKLIPKSQNGKIPLSFYTSTRKFSYGLVQQEIDKANESGLKIYHWNIIDMTQACTPERHLPSEPRIKIFYNQDRLTAISEEEWLLLSEKEQQTYKQKIGFKGCLTQCKIFASCLGLLSYKQKSTSHFLAPIDETQTLLRTVPLEIAKSQLLCLKPSSEGLIYPNFSKETHMLTAGQMASRITGEEYPVYFNKGNLVNLLKELKAEFFCGMDHGYTHDFAVTTAALIGHILYVFDVIAVKGMELADRIEMCKERLLPLNPRVYPDNAYPADNTAFARNGFRVIDFDKDVLKGIESVRVRLSPGRELPISLFLLKGDEGCEALAKDLSSYHWKTNSNGELEEKPDKVDDDRPDSLRYLCQNVSPNKYGVIVAKELNPVNPYANKNPQASWMKEKIEELTKDGDQPSVSVDGDNSINYSF